MSEDRTKELNDQRPLEERVNRMEIRITNLEHKEYDTKPIWERALAEIAETNRRMGELALEMRAGNQALRLEFQTANETLRNDLRFEFLTVNEALRNDLRSEFQSGIEGLRKDLGAEFQSGIEGLRKDLGAEFQSGIEGLREDLGAEFQSGIDGLRKEMKAEFAGVRHQLAHELRGVARKIDTLNHNFLEMQTEQRYLDRRLEELETQVKTT